MTFHSGTIQIQPFKAPKEPQDHTPSWVKNLNDRIQLETGRKILTEPPQKALGSVWERRKHHTASRRLQGLQRVLEGCVDPTWGCIEILVNFKLMHHRNIPTTSPLWDRFIDEAERVVASIKPSAGGHGAISARYAVKSALFSARYTEESAICAAETYKNLSFGPSLDAVHKSWEMEADNLLIALKSIN